jgi:hypothetical protein
MRAGISLPQSSPRSKENVGKEMLSNFEASMIQNRKTFFIIFYWLIGII